MATCPQKIFVIFDCGSVAEWPQMIRVFKGLHTIGALQKGLGVFKGLRPRSHVGKLTDFFYGHDVKTLK